MQTSNLVYTHPGQDQMQVEVILASQGPSSPPIYTVRMRYPRPIHGEIMTHRVFGRNARSSRAVPVRTMLNEVEKIPYIPWHWLKNKPGMQGTEPLTEDEQIEAEMLWLIARDYAVNITKQLFDPDGLNIHKQNPNRLLEPFSWIDTLITSTDWENFLWLRDHGAAEPHLRDLAKLVDRALKDAHIHKLEYAEWHRPYISPMDIQNVIIRPTEDTQRVIDELGCDGNELLNMLSAARCARISYRPFDGNASYRAEFDRYNMLVTSDRVHASPLEHQATPDAAVGSVSRGGAYGVEAKMETIWSNPHLHGNLTGYIQARKLVPNEVYSSI